MRGKTTPSVAELQGIAQKLRRYVIRMLCRAGSGHPGGSLSAAEIVTTLLFAVMHHHPGDPTWPDRDRLILSKGHAVPVLYAALAEAGYFPAKMLWMLRQLGSPLQGHPVRQTIPGIEMSTGSLGQGLSVGIGMALAAQLDQRPYHVFVVIGDGESDEGQIWEAAMAASHFAAQGRLAPLVATLDHNGLQIDGPNCAIMNLKPLADKWRAFGWHTIEVDGHSVEELLTAFSEADKIRGKPVMIIAETVKGKGVSFMEGQVDWHGKAPDRLQTLRALRDLEEREKWLL